MNISSIRKEHARHRRLLQKERKRRRNGIIALVCMLVGGVLAGYLIWELLSYV